MDSTRLSPTFALFALPSFWGGFGQVLDFGNTMFEFNQSLTGEQADYFALKGDWLAIGEDFYDVIEQTPPEEIAQAVA
jgi:hypothetical protein